MHRRLYMWIGFILLLAVVLGTWLLPSGALTLGLDLRSPNEPPIPTQKQKPSTEQEIVYPGSTLEEVDSRSDSTWRHVVYRTSIKHREVLNWYKAHLPENGWTSGGLSNSPDFLRLEADGDVSWILGLNVGIEVFENGDTGVHLSTGRSPDVTNIPLYPGAQSVEIVDKREAQQDGTTTQVRLISYLIDEEAQQVESYYRKRLTNEYAWRDILESSSITSDTGLRFGDGGYSLLIINAETSAQSPTKVVIRLEQDL